MKIGVLGVGHLGKIHLKCIQMIDDYELVGFYDPNEDNATAAINTYSVKRFTDIEELIDAVDVVDIITPTITHFELAKLAIQKGKHVFIEKPLTNTIEEGQILLELSQQHGVKVQVGHVERFNPAFLSLGDTPLNPKFIEAHRLAMFNPRGTDVSVVLDLMIHDLDILLSMVPSKVRKINASGVAVVSDTPDISNARIEFENGCVANLTASRISMKQMRKVRLFQKDAYISIDFLEKKSEVIRLYDKTASNLQSLDSFVELPTPKGDKLIQIKTPKAEPSNAIKMELELFAKSIRENTRPIVSIKDGFNALKLAHQIIEEIEKSVV